jgi:hypothetical protein
VRTKKQQEAITAALARQVLLSMGSVVALGGCSNEEAAERYVKRAFEVSEHFENVAAKRRAKAAS